MVCATIITTYYYTFKWMKKKWKKDLELKDKRIEAGRTIVSYQRTVSRLRMHDQTNPGYVK